MRFIAMARFSCASLLMLPKLMAPVAKRRDDLRGWLDLVEGQRSLGGAESQQPRRVNGRSSWSLMARAYSSYDFASCRRTARCRLATVFGLQRCRSPPTRQA